MVSKILNGIILVFVMLRMYSVNCHPDTTGALKGSTTIRNKRSLSLYFPHNSCHALAIVLSLPISDLPADRSVFVAYNFEANFYYPYFGNKGEIFPSPFNWMGEPGARELIDTNEKLAKEAIDGNLVKEEMQLDRSSNDTTVHQEHDVQASKEISKLPKGIKDTKVHKTKKKTRKNRSPSQNYFMSRRRFYKLMETKLDRSGLQGNDCLLKAVCETAQTRFGSNNGVIGSVIDVLFLPSASKDEKLPKRYYQAENNGRSGSCDLYNRKCPKGIFDVISKII